MLNLIPKPTLHQTKQYYDLLGNTAYILAAAKNPFHLQNNLLKVNEGEVPRDLS